MKLKFSIFAVLLPALFYAATAHGLVMYTYISSETQNYSGMHYYGTNGQPGISTPHSPDPYYIEQWHWWANDYSIGDRSYSSITYDETRFRVVEDTTQSESSDTTRQKIWEGQLWEWVSGDWNKKGDLMKDYYDFPLTLDISTTVSLVPLPAVDSPEPSGLLLMGLGLAGLGFARRKKAA